MDDSIFILNYILFSVSLKVILNKVNHNCIFCVGILTLYKILHRDSVHHSKFQDHALNGTNVFSAKIYTAACLWYQWYWIRNTSMELPVIAWHAYEFSWESINSDVMGKDDMIPYVYLCSWIRKVGYKRSQRKG